MVAWAVSFLLVGLVIAPLIVKSIGITVGSAIALPNDHRVRPLTVHYVNQVEAKHSKLLACRTTGA